MSKLAIRWTVFTVLCLCVITPCLGQELGASEPQANIGLAGTIGMLFFGDTDLPSFTTFGVSGGAYLRPGVEIGIAYSRAGISFLGIELMSINLFDVYLGADLSPAERFGILLRLGGCYLQANALGEGIGGLVVLAGAGLRISPIEMVDIFALYNARFRNDLLNSIEAGIRVRF